MSSSRNFSSMSRSSRGIRSSSSASSLRLMVSSSRARRALTFSSVAALAAAASGVSSSSASAATTTASFPSPFPSSSSSGTPSSAGLWSLKTGSVGSSAGSDPTGAFRLLVPSLFATSANAPSTSTSGNPASAATTTTAPSRPAVTSRPPGHATMAPAPPSSESCAATDDATFSPDHVDTTPSPAATARRPSPAATSPPIAALRTPAGAVHRGLSVSVVPDAGRTYVRTDRSAAIAANFPESPAPATATSGSSTFADRTSAPALTAHASAGSPAAPRAGGTTTATVALGPATRS
mmetsp:Transcript_8124/g.35905  ORF Transcript_8124/g.35905 Transcript_8124/m.35905 type:complete len:294 (+) Transcript_8124:3351-4232(+)